MEPKQYMSYINSENVPYALIYHSYWKVSRSLFLSLLLYSAKKNKQKLC